MKKQNLQTHKWTEVHCYMRVLSEGVKYNKYRIVRPEKCLCEMTHTIHVACLVLSWPSPSFPCLHILCVVELAVFCTVDQWPVPSIPRFLWISFINLQNIAFCIGNQSVSSYYEASCFRYQLQICCFNRRIWWHEKKDLLHFNNWKSIYHRFLI